MLFISLHAHQKFTIQCQSLLTGESHRRPDPVTEQLKTDIQTLQDIADSYAALLAKLPALSSDYKALQKRIRVGVRKLKSKKSFRTSTQPLRWTAQVSDNTKPANYPFSNTAS